MHTKLAVTEHVPLQSNLLRKILKVRLRGAQMEKICVFSLIHEECFPVFENLNNGMKSTYVIISSAQRPISFDEQRCRQSRLITFKGHTCIK